MNLTVNHLNLMYYYCLKFLNMYPSLEEFDISENLEIKHSNDFIRLLLFIGIRKNLKILRMRNIFLDTITMGYLCYMLLQ